MTLPAATLDTPLQRTQTHLQVHQPDVSRQSRKIQIQTPTLPRPSLPPRSHRHIPLQTTRFSSTSQPWPNPQQSPDPRWSQSPSSKGTKVRVSYPGANHSTAAKSNFSGQWPRRPRWLSPEPAPRWPVGSEPNACPGRRTMCGTRTLVSGQQSLRGLDRRSRLYSRCTPFPTSSRGRMNHVRTSWTASDWRSTCYITMSQPQTRPPSPTRILFARLVKAHFGTGLRPEIGKVVLGVTNLLATMAVWRRKVRPTGHATNRVLIAIKCTARFGLLPTVTFPSLLYISNCHFS